MTTTPRTETGRYRALGSGDTAYRAFVPAPLPPDLRLTEEDYDLMERATRALGRLDGISSLLPDRDLFLYLYVRKEAILSSQIEGTQSSLTDLLQHEDGAAPGVPLHDVQEVSNYVAALDHGLDRLRNDDFPLSLRLIREVHEVLLQDGRGANKTPGAFRRSQVWIGGERPWTATFVPPPPDELDACLDAFETYLHRPGVPVLIKAALAHVQFETIHPFLDGNGRVGRLLITFLLCAEDVLTDPLLYLSLFFKTHRAEYYERLQRVRTHGEWEAWLRYFLRGVQETSKQAVDTAREILELFEADRGRIREGAGRSAGSVLQVQEVMQRRPLVTIAEATKRSSLTYATVRSALETMEQLGLVREIPDRQVRTFHYARYLDILERGTEPL
ncbi:MAG: Fic family protein [Rubricoccaceae bacterium]|nr:Fic family protein [Rubricoccaceae bacterium]